MDKITRYFLLFVAVRNIGVLDRVDAETYANSMTLFDDKLGSSSYRPELRPLLDQTRPLMVHFDFELVSIVELSDVAQSFIVNAFLVFDWVDEIVAWDPDMYGGVKLIHPLPENVWRPRVVLINTLGDRDLFDDDKAPLFVSHTGDITWVPGSLFPTSCQLTMSNYPFDEQTCIIKISAMTLSSAEMQFAARNPSVKQTFFTPHGEWEVKDTNISVSELNTGASRLSYIQVTFTLKRRPNFLLINIVLPIVFLSFLNLLVFVIPEESGEKIGYGITVLLALSVFMSIVSSMLPRSSVTLPKVTIYLFVLFILSMLTVIDSIVIVYLSHLEEKEEQHMKATSNFRSALKTVTNLRRAVSPMPKDSANQMNGFSKTSRMRLESLGAALEEGDLPRHSSPIGSGEGETTTKKKKTKVNKYKVIGKHIDLISFVVFFILWVVLTLAFLLNIALTI